MITKPKIGILTTFTGSDEAFSLVVVVKTQLEMLVEAGYEPVLFVIPGFQGSGIWEDSHVETRRTISYDASTPDITSCLRGLIGDIDVMLCHDIIFLSNYAHWARAVRILIKEFPNIRWLHWQHSRGDQNPMEVLHNSEFCYPNEGDLEHVAIINSTDMSHVHYIPHPLDFDYLGWDKLAIRIAEDFQFPFVDVSMIYPTRPQTQKQIDKSIRVFSGFKKAGRSVCLLVADAYATGDEFLKVKKDCLDLAHELGLTNKEFAFLGEVYPECKYWTPRQTVKALFEMSSIFMQTSNAETSSLVALEAALAGNLLVLNANFKPIHHLYKKALKLEFSSIFEPDMKYYRVEKNATADGGEVKIEDKQFYFDDHVKSLLIPILDGQLTISVKRQQLRDRWPSRVMRDYMEPLLLKGWTPPELKCEGDHEITAIVTTMDNLPLLKKQIPVLMKEVGNIIIVDQESKDGAAKWMDELDCPNIKIIHRINNGAGPGRNAGLALWDKNPTPYTVMIDGGILPPLGGISAMKKYLIDHPSVEVISPEIMSCYTTNEDEAMKRVTEPLPDITFQQRMLTSTAYGMQRASAWRVRFSEEGPFGEPGWGVDDNDMAYRWDQAGVIHHDFANSVSGWKLYRRAGGSHQRLFEETGIWPNQYGSVYEKRNLKCLHDWRIFHSGLYGRQAIPTFSYIIQDIPMPEFAKLVKKLHDNDVECEVLAKDYDPLVKEWLDMFALRWHHGDTTIDSNGKIIKKGVDYPEELWSGDVVRDRGPLTEKTIVINKDNMKDYLKEEEKIVETTLTVNATGSEWQMPKESEFSQPTTLCPHPEWWSSENYMATEVEVSQLIATLVRAVQPEFVVEIGSHYGQTTERIGTAIIGNGHGEFVSLELDSGLYGVAVNRCTGLLSDKVQILNSNSLEYIPPKPIDFLFVDGAVDRVADVKHYLPYMAPRSYIIVHDMVERFYLNQLKEVLEFCGGNHIQLDTPRSLLIIKLP
jgi:glycosyltransferase involved in cell wall biosynthesis